MPKATFNCRKTNQTPLVFILGSPRTGSTLLYQFLINFFDFFYFTNFINDYFTNYLFIGAFINQQINLNKPVSYKSVYGKTKGGFGPSEASLILRNWFGGGHPSETKSRSFLPKKKEQMEKTLQSIYDLIGRPIMFKNPWNCFRIEVLSETFPKSLFIWNRRDISRSALSDLVARRRRGDPAKVWSASTPANYRELQKLPEWEQVVEDQYEHNRAVADALAEINKRRYVEVWYEDLCLETGRVVKKLNEFLVTNGLEIRKDDIDIPKFRLTSIDPSLVKDYERIKEYVGKNKVRLKSFSNDKADW